MSDWLRAAAKLLAVFFIASGLLSLGGGVIVGGLALVALGAVLWRAACGEWPLLGRVR